MERLRRLSDADCRHKQIFSCHGCPVQAIAIAQINQSNTDLIKSGGIEHWTNKHDEKQIEIIREVSKSCPEGETVRLYDVEIIGHGV